MSEQLKRIDRRTFLKVAAAAGAGLAAKLSLPDTTSAGHIPNCRTELTVQNPARRSFRLVIQDLRTGNVLTETPVSGQETVKIPITAPDNATRDGKPALATKVYNKERPDQAKEVTTNCGFGNTVPIREVDKLTPTPTPMATRAPINTPVPREYTPTPTPTLAPTETPTVAPGIPTQCLLPGAVFGGLALIAAAIYSRYHPRFWGHDHDQVGQINPNPIRFFQRPGTHDFDVDLNPQFRRRNQGQ